MARVPKLIEAIEAQAAVRVRETIGQYTPNVYGVGYSVATFERAFAQALEDEPETYATYRNLKNARVYMAQLKAAGVKLLGA